MFSSLDRLDVGATLPDGEGGSIDVFMQTDHRSTADILREASLSIVFALARCLNARAQAEGAGRGPFRVVYNLESDAPAFLTYAVEVAGATVVRSVETAARAPERTPRVRELEALMNDAVARLAEEVWQREGLEPSLAALAAYEARHYPRPAWVPDREEDEPGFFRAVVTLGALAASVLGRRLTDVSWRTAAGTLPFALTGELDGAQFHRIDLFGKAREFATHGPDEALSSLVAVVLGEPLTHERPMAALGVAIEPEALEARALEGRPDDTPSREHAEALARAAASALRSWGLSVGDSVSWVTRRAREIDLRVIGRQVQEGLAEASRGLDGHSAIFEELQPIGAALERAVARHGHLDGKRDDLFADAEFRSASAYMLRVPASAPAFAGALYRDMPNPFAPLLAVWATGYLVESMNETGITLIIVAPP